MIDAFRNRSGADVRFSFTLRPALDFEALLRTLGRLARRGDLRSRASLRGLVLAAMAQLAYPRSTHYTNPLLRVLIRCAARLGRAMGYRID